MTWFLITVLVVGSTFVVGYHKSYDTQAECAAALLEFEEAPAGPNITNWHGVCLPGYRDEPEGEAEEGVAT